MPYGKTGGLRARRLRIRYRRCSSPKHARTLQSINVQDKFPCRIGGRRSSKLPKFLLRCHLPWGRHRQSARRTRPTPRNSKYVIVAPTERDLDSNRLHEMLSPKKLCGDGRSDGGHVLERIYHHDRYWIKFRSLVKQFGKPEQIRSLLGNEGVHRAFTRLRSLRGPSGSKHFGLVVKQATGQSAMHTTRADYLVDFIPSQLLTQGGTMKP